MEFYFGRKQFKSSPDNKFGSVPTYLPLLSNNESIPLFQKFGIEKKKMTTLLVGKECFNSHNDGMHYICISLRWKFSLVIISAGPIQLYQTNNIRPKIRPATQLGLPIRSDGKRFFFLVVVVEENVKDWFMLLLSEKIIAGVD